MKPSSEANRAAAIERRVILLGPQRLFPTLIQAVNALENEGLPAGRIAAVTAGWEEREGEDQELSAHLGGRTINLRIWERGEDAYGRDKELHAAVRERNEKLRVLQELYQLRLAHLLSAADAILARGLPPGLQSIYQEECESAIEAVRALDREHLTRIREQHMLFEERWKPLERDSVTRHRDELRKLLEDCSLVCIAGGHVSILLRRLRLFGFAQLLQQQPLIAWSAGAMVAAERVVLFHDDPPQGAGSAEVYEAGLAITKGVIPLPHADKRLELGDRRRVALFARRFSPDLCAVLPPKTRADCIAGVWSAQSGTRFLHAAGDLRELEVRP
ncbi:MAG: Type 1 glutamine amidotransferase-like domain-containing protein [Planctomycetia bacterium]